MQTRPNPPPPELKRPVEALLAGDPGPFSAVLDTLADWNLRLAADAVLRHYTDLPVDLFAGRPIVGLEYRRDLAWRLLQLPA